MSDIGKQAKGKFKELKGKVTGDKSEKVQGKVDQATVKVKRAAYDEDGPTVEQETMAPQK